MQQLDPHFIFNSLNHIQYFINSGDKGTALGYVSRFSKFMRQLMMLSQHSHNSMEREALLLVRYLELEKMRFEDRFDYSISMPGHTCPDRVPVPSLMLYHLVSSLMYTRVLHHDKKATLKIKAVYREPFIYFTLEDDIVLPDSAYVPAAEQGKLAALLHTLNDTHRHHIRARQRILRAADKTPAGNVLEVRLDMAAAIHGEQQVYG